MPQTVANQKNVIIHKDRPQQNFIQISNDHWMEFNKKYGPYALQVYLYLAKNADGFNLALSAQAAENEAGIKRTTFHKYIDLLIAEGYLVKRHGNTYDFYETPQKQEEEEIEPPPHDGPACAWENFESPPCDLPGSPDKAEFPQSDIEIYKRQKDNIKIEGNIIQQEGESREQAEETSKKQEEFIF